MCSSCVVSVFCAVYIVLVSVIVSMYFDAHCTLVLYCIVLYCIILYRLYCIVLYCIVLYCIVLYCNVLKVSEYLNNLKI